jgi:hypothetical protein
MHCLQKGESLLELFEGWELHLCNVFGKLEFFDAFLLVLVTDWQRSPAKHFDDLVAA